MPVVIKVGEKEVGKLLDFTIQENKAAFNLTGYSVKMLVEGGKSVDLVVVTPADGLARYTVLGTEWKPRDYVAQLSIYKASPAKDIRSELFTLRVEKSL